MVGDQLLESCCPLDERGVMQNLSWDLYLQVYTIYNKNNLGFLGLFRGGTFDLYGTYSVWETLPPYPPGPPSCPPSWSAPPMPTFRTHHRLVLPQGLKVQNWWSSLETCSLFGLVWVGRWPLHWPRLYDISRWYIVNHQYWVFWREISWFDIMCV